MGPFRGASRAARQCSRVDGGDNYWTQGTSHETYLNIFLLILKKEVAGLTDCQDYSSLKSYYFYESLPFLKKKKEESYFWMEE